MVTKNPKNKSTQDPPPTETNHDFHGAAVIDEQGKEVPITEDMVKRACEKLDESSVYPEKEQPSKPEQS